MKASERGFAKLFGDGANQILVKLDQSEPDCTPEVRLYFKPKGLGVCSLALSWDSDSDVDWEKAEKAFSAIDEDKARQIVDKAINQLIAGGQE